MKIACKSIRIQAICLLLLLFSAVAQAQTFPGTDVGVIPPGGLPGLSGPEAYLATRDIVFDVSGLDGTIDTVSVEFSADHTFVGDLRVTLISPIGVPHLLFSRSGSTTAGGAGDGSNLEAGNVYRFSDTATVNWWDHITAATATVPGVTARTTVEGGAGVPNPAPVTSLNDVFRYTPPNGRWILRFEDGFNGDDGEVLSASLELTVQGTTRVVNTNNSSFADSLEQILPLAQAGDLITFGDFFDQPQTLQLLSALPTITQPIAIQGPGADRLTIRRRDSAPEFRIFNIAASGQVSISGLGISNGSVQAFGGGLIAESPVVLSDLHVFGNLADNGGGAAIGSVRALIIDSTFSGNRTRFQSGGLSIINPAPGSRMIGVTVSDNVAGSWPAGVNFINFSAAPASFEILNSTIVNNRAGGFLGGIRAEASGGDMTLLLRNSIVSDNAPLNFDAASFTGTATIQSLGFNLSSSYDGAVGTVDSDLTGEARLGPLALYGGTVPTHPPLAGSPAIDNGKAFRGGPRGGARAEPRLFDDSSTANPDISNGADIGAVEMRSIYVTTDADSGPGSLRQAITDANDNGPELDDLQFDPGFFGTQPRVIDLASALPGLSSSMALHGPGSRLATVQRSAPEAFRILSVQGGLERVAVSGLTLRNGSEGFGGGILSDSPLTLIESVVSDSESTFGSGGGVVLSASSWIDRSAIVGNSSAEDGGGLAFFGADQTLARITQSTISGNQATARGGGVASLVFGGRADIEIEGSTIADNQAAIEHDAVAALIINGNFTFIFLRGSILSGRADTPVVGSEVFVSGTAVMASRGFNLFTDDFSTGFAQPSDLIEANPGLGPLTSIGSPTPIHPLLPGSDAIDAGSSQGRIVSSDQRGPGFLRLVDLNEANAGPSDGTDIGAFEAQGEPQFDGVFDDRFEAP